MSIATHPSQEFHICARCGLRAHTSCKLVAKAVARCGSPIHAASPTARASAGNVHVSLLHVYDLGVDRGANIYGVLSW